MQTVLSLALLSTTCVEGEKRVIAQTEIFSSIDLYYIRTKLAPRYFVTMEAMRKYSINVSAAELLEQLHEQLRHLHTNTRMHFQKKKKLVLQLERRNNQWRRRTDRSDAEQQKKLADNTHLIRLIKKTIVDEDREEQQRRRDEQGQSELWSLGGLTATVTVAMAGIVSAATLIVIMFVNTKERNL